MVNHSGEKVSSKSKDVVNVSVPVIYFISILNSINHVEAGIVGTVYFTTLIDEIIVLVIVLTKIIKIIDKKIKIEKLERIIKIDLILYVFI